MKDFTLFLEKQFENEQPLMDAIRKNCLDIDISSQVPPLCDFLRMNFCVYMQFKNVSKIITVIFIKNFLRTK